MYYGILITIVGLVLYTIAYQFNKRGYGIASYLTGIPGIIMFVLGIIWVIVEIVKLF